MRIYLGSTDVAVAQHTLYAANIGAIHQEVGRETMSHRVRTDMFGNTSQPRVFID